MSGNHYATLGISKKASQAQVKKSYHRLVNNKLSKTGRVPGSFHQLKRAYDTLSGPQQRREYNRRQRASREKAKRDKEADSEQTRELKERLKSLEKELADLEFRKEGIDLYIVMIHDRARPIARDLNTLREETAAVARKDAEDNANWWTYLSVHSSMVTSKGRLDVEEQRRKRQAHRDQRAAKVKAVEDKLAEETVLLSNLENDQAEIEARLMVLRPEIHNVKQQIKDAESQEGIVFPPSTEEYLRFFAESRAQRSIPDPAFHSQPRPADV